MTQQPGKQSGSVSGSDLKTLQKVQKIKLDFRKYFTYRTISFRSAFLIKKGINKIYNKLLAFSIKFSVFVKNINKKI